ncbi:MAG: VOC family protein [Archangium sp.]|nr:VOC family protein [Archangium sp.]
MKVLGFHHVAVQVRDVARVAAFYTELLQLPELKRFHRPDGSLRSIWVGTGTAQAQTQGGFIAVEGAEAGVSGAIGFSMVALRIEASQRRTIVEELARRGLPLERETGWTLYVRDPEGNLVGLSHHPDDSPSTP